MSLKPKTQRLRTSESRKQIIVGNKGYLHTESTFQNSNNTSSRGNDDFSHKIFKAVLKVEKSVDKLKKVCQMSNRNDILPSNIMKSKDKSKQVQTKWLKEMTISQLQRFYMLTYKQSTNDIQKLHKFYRDYFLQGGSSSSSRQSPACRINKRKTIQDIKLSQPVSPEKSNSKFKQRRGSEAFKDQFFTTNFRQPTLKTQVSNKNLKQLYNYSRQRSSGKKQTLQASSQKNKLKSILKKPSFQAQNQIKPQLKLTNSSLADNKSKQFIKSAKLKLNSGILRSMQSSPIKQKQLIKLSTRNNNLSKSRTKELKISTTKNKIVYSKKSQSNLKDLLDQINQLSPISNSSFRK